MVGQDGTTIVVQDYFSIEPPPALISPEGAILTGDVVALLAGPMAPGQYAQVGQPEGAVPIGQVETIEGGATATRANGVVVQLKLGDPVFQNDVIQTSSGSSLGITFIDETVFSLSGGSRMVLNELVYQPNGQSNSMLFNLVQGTFSFVAGQVAPTGDMKIETPVATMGIRGTWPIVKILAANGATDFSILIEPDGTVGLYQLFDKINGNLLGTVDNAATKLTLASVLAPVVEVPKSQSDVAQEQAAQGQLAQTFSRWQARSQAGETPVQTPGDQQPNEPQQDQPQQDQPQQDQPSPEQQGSIEGGDTADQIETGSIGQEVLGSGAPSEITTAELTSTPVAITTTTTQQSSAPSADPGPTAGGSGAGGTTPGASTTTTELPDVGDPAPPPPPPQNSPPTVVAPTIAPAVTEDTTGQIPGINVSDDGTGDLTASITTTPLSTVSLVSTAGLAFIEGTGVNDSRVQFTGSAAAITTALNGLTFNPAPDAEIDGGLTISINDGTQTTTQNIIVPIVPVPDPPVITVASLFVEENSTDAGTVAASDPDTNDTLTFAISGGADAARFSIDQNTGALNFVGAPDFENPQDIGGTAGDNVYEVEVQVTDSDNLTATQTVQVQVNDVNDNAPVITSANIASVAENTTTVLQVTATDTEPLSFALTVGGNGADNGLFAIDAVTGDLSFINAPDFEAPGDVGADNGYQVEVAVSDGVNTTTQVIGVTVTDVNDNAPVITSANTVNVAENTTSVLQVTATDADGVGGPLGFALTVGGNGADNGLFAINALTGELSFINAPDFEAPADVGADNGYQVEVAVSDGVNTTTQVIGVTVTDVNDNAPVITSANTASVVENTTSVLQVAATDADGVGGPLGFALTVGGNGTDNGLFTIDAVTGELSFIDPPDFEAPGDVGADNGYQVEVAVSDGVNTTTQVIDVTVTDVNDNAPVITSANTASVPENTTTVLQVTATDTEPLSFALTVGGNGADNGLFAIDAVTGALSFIDAPDFEAPGDVGADNGYQVEVAVSDGINTTTQVIGVTVTDVNDDAPVITSANTASVPENTTAVLQVTATDTEPLSFALTVGGNGADNNLFAIDAVTGALSFINAPDFEAPGDVGADNGYQVEVAVSDGVNTTTQVIGVTVTDVNDNAPVITSANTSSVAENTTSVLQVAATDADGVGGPLDFALTVGGNGTDNGLFTINAVTGDLSFIDAPDFEAPGDAGADNGYQVEVAVSDGVNTTTQVIGVTVTDVNDNAPVITSANTASVVENTTIVLQVTATDTEPLSFALTVGGNGADNGLFSIDAVTGDLSFINAPDFEAPGDVGADNGYQVEVAVSDGVNTTTQVIGVTVTDANDNAPVITSANTANVAENTTSVLQVTATDADGVGGPLGFALTVGGNGADNGLFAIDAVTGELSFINAPDFESPADVGADNGYQVEVAVSDGVNTTTQVIGVTVTDVNDNAPVITSANTANVAENTTSVLQVTATDADGVGGPLGFALTVGGNGADNGLFAIDTVTGALSFINAPDFEAPGDVGADNGYQVEVAVSDGVNTTTQVIDVTVTDVNDDAPVITSANTANVAENTTAVLQVTATDTEPLSFALTVGGNGADNGLFTIDAVTGELSFINAPDFEAPVDVGADNGYQVEIAVSDGVNTTTQVIDVTVTDVNDNAPVITSANTANVAENTTSVLQVTATDADGIGGPLGFALTVGGNGADNGLFAIDAITGELSFINAPDFEAPADVGADNGYQVEVAVSDGVNTTTQVIGVTVTDVNDDAPVITSANTASVPENTTTVLQVTATDTEPLSFALTVGGNGADNGLFAIDAVTGALSFIDAPDFETPGDVGADNGYQVEVAVSDGVNTTTQVIGVTVTDVNDNAPVITSANIASVAENTSAVLQVTATDADGVGGPLDFALTVGGNGADNGLFAIDAVTGELSFINAPDFETPGDVGADNGYQVEVAVSDGVNTTTQVIDVTVTDANDNAPVITSANTANVAENTTSVLQVTATDADGVGGPLGFALTVGGNGADNGLFAIDVVTGELSFINAPDFEAPGDVGADNGYQVEVAVSDGVNITTQVIGVTVTDVNDDAPLITSANAVNVAENTTAVLQVTATDTEPLSFALTVGGNGADNGLFAIDAVTGELSFINAPDFEAPGDAGADNGYQLEVAVSDGVNTTTQVIDVTVTDVNDNAPVITSANTVNVTENTTSVLQVTATDADGIGGPLGFALTVGGNGADNGLFAIDAVTGALSFINAPDFEAPSDVGADNGYQVEVAVSDGVNTTTQVIGVTVTDVNDNAPAITSANTASVAENTTSVLQVTATDADGVGGPLGFALTVGGNGADNGLFAIDAVTGALSFINAPDFEAPGDVGADNGYQVEVAVSDGVNTTTQVIDVTVTDVNDNAPVITSANTANVAENTTSVLQVTATDTEPLSFALTVGGNGIDNSLFTIDAVTGDLSFIDAPDFEAPGDVGADNGYQVEVAVSDGVNTTIQVIDVTVTDVNDNAPFITSTNTASVAENTTSVLQVTATDADGVGGPLGFALTVGGNGADNGLFAIDAVTGELSFINAPDFEAPGDVGADNGYQVEVAVSDGVNTTTQVIDVTVTDVNDNAPVITSANAVNVPENTTAVLQVTATDTEPLSFALTVGGNGTDNGLFAIDAVTGDLSFINAPDFEAPGDAGADNGYQVEVAVSDGVNTTTQVIDITVTDVNDNAPVITSANIASVPENTTSVLQVTATDADGVGGPLGFALTVGGNGADNGLFAIDAVTGELSFINAPDFEAPGDVGADNGYQVEVAVSDGVNTTTQVIDVTVTDVNDNAPVITSANIASVPENTTSVLQVTATDADGVGDPLGFALTVGGNGADNGLFAIDAITGALSFINAPDFEAPGDVGADNGYQVEVAVSDGVNTTTQVIDVTVTDVNDNAPVITSANAANVAENTTSVLQVTATDADGVGGPLGFALTVGGNGTDNGLFAIDAVTGALSFINAPDFEAPGDVGADNGYQVEVAVSDGVNTTTQVIGVTVTDVNDNAPVITSATTASVAENTTSVLQVTATDADGVGGPLGFALTVGGNGTDNGLFAIDAVTGELSFINAPDFEAPGDVGADNGYQVEVAVSDGVNTTTQVIDVTVTDINDNAPVITSANTASIAENTASVLQVAATDADGVGGPLSFGITGNGADDALFTINAVTGALSFIAAPDFEAPGDVGGDNGYQVEVAVFDGINTTTQVIDVTITDVDDTAPVAVNDGFTTDEDTALGGDVRANDSDVDTPLGNLTVTSVNGSPIAIGSPFAPGATLDDPTVTGADKFGGSVAISGNKVLVGAPEDDTGGVNVGQAHLFDATTGALLQTFDDPTVTNQDTFGSSVAVSGNNVLIGSPGDDTSGNNVGLAHLFDATTGALLQTFDDPTVTNQDIFGSSVAISGNNVLIGSPGDDTNGTNVGQVHLFDLTTGALLRTFNDPTVSGADRFGFSVAIDGNNVLIGAATDSTNGAFVGQAYLFDATTGALLQTFDDPTVTSQDQFGVSVAIDGSNVLIGANHDATNGLFVGQAHLFDATTGAFLRTFDDPTLTATDQFGFSVDLDGDNVLIGAFGDDTAGNEVGQAHLFDATTGALLQTFNDPTVTTGDNLGFSVAIDGGNVVVGANLDDTAGADVGQAHLFTGTPQQIILPSGALLTMNPDGTFAYDPNGQFDNLAAGETGLDSFTYTLDDGNGGTDTATVTITIDGVNDAPFVSTNAGLTVDEGSADTVIDASTLAVSDVDNSVGDLIYTVSGPPANGSILLNGSALGLNDTFTQTDIDAGLLTYSHDGSETTADSIGFSVSDGIDTVTSQSLAITVTPVNDAPVITVAPSLFDDFNDNSIDPSLWTTVIATQTSTVEEVNGRIELTSRGFLVSAAEYTPTASTVLRVTGEVTLTNANDTFKIFTRSDAIAEPQSGGEVASGIAVTLTGFQQTARITVRTAGSDTTLDSDLISFIANTAYAFEVIDDGSNIFATFTQVSNPSNTVTLTADIDFAGAGNFVVFNNIDNPARTVFLDNIAISHPTIALAAQEDTALAITDISISDVDAGGGDITVMLEVNDGTLTVSDAVIGGLGAGDIAGNGSATVILTGTLAEINATLADVDGFKYLGDLDFSGIDTLTITANDQGNTGIDPGLTGDANSEQDVQTVTINVDPVNDAPVAILDLLTGVTGTPITGNVLADNGFGADFDPDIGETATLTMEITGTVFSERGGLVTLSANGDFTYTPVAGFTGQDAFVYSVTDVNGATAQHYVELAVSPTSTAPVNLTGDAGDNILQGNSGLDTLIGLGGNDTLNSGGAPQERIGGFVSSDILEGGAGNDTLTSEGGASILRGGAGNDTIQVLDSGLFWDWAIVDYEVSTGNIIANFTNATITGTPVGDLASNEVIDGVGGVDTVTGVHVFQDGEGNDQIFVDDSYSNSFGQFLEVRLSKGDDLVDFSAAPNNARRVSYKNAGGGVKVDLSTAVAGVVMAVDFGNPLGTFIGTDTLVNVNQVRGSDHDDMLVGDANNNRLRGSGGNDQIDGGAGVDRARYIDSPDGVDVDLSIGMALDDGFGTQDTLNNIEDVDGGVFDDRIQGDGSGNRLAGYAGDDTLIGLAGNDLLIGDFEDPDFSDGGFGGNDRLFGGAGADILRGGDGDDFLDGGAGDDQLFGGSGNDTLIGGLGNDTLRSGGSSLEAIGGFSGIDRLVGGEGDDTLISEGGGSLLVGGPGNDTIQVFDNGFFWDFAIADYRTSTGDIIGNFTSTTMSGTPVGDLLSGQIIDGLGGVDTASGFHVIADGSGNDEFHFDTTFSNSYGNWIEARLSEGNDFVDFGGANVARISYRFAGGGVRIDLTPDAVTGLQSAEDVDPLDTFIGTDTFIGANRARGSKFDDVLLGSDANERFRGSEGVDFIDGGGGTDDRLEFFDSPTGVVVNLSLASGQVINDGFGNTEDVINIEGVSGNVFDDTLTGDGGNNTLWGFAGADTIFGGAGDDSISGDFFDLEFDNGGPGGDDVLDGGAGNDFIQGGDGNDTITGGSDDDFIRPGSGDDAVDGGTGFDQVSYQFFTALTGGITYTGGTGAGGNGIAVGDGLVTGDVNIGTDTLISIEGIEGTFLSDNFTGGDAFELFSPLEGTDSVDGGGGGNQLQYFNLNLSAGDPGVTISYSAPGAGTATSPGGVSTTFVNVQDAEGSFGDDMITGSASGEFLGGLGGSDIIEGGAGNDLIDGGDGVDTIVGGAGADDLRGGNDFAQIFSGLPFAVRQFFDTVDYSQEGGGGAVTVDLGAGTATDTFGNSDTLSGLERVVGTAGNDTLTGGGEDEFEEFVGGGGNDVINGATGFDQVSYQFAAGQVAVNFSGVQQITALGAVNNNQAIDGDGGIDTLSNIESIRGSQNADFIFTGGPDGFMRVRPLGGNDFIDGSAAFTEVDYVFSGAVTGVIVNLDSAFAHAGVGANQALDATGDTDTFINVEAARGTEFADQFFGGAGFQRFRGLAGDDSFDGGDDVDAVDYRTSTGLGGGGITVNLDTVIHNGQAAGTATDGFGDTDTFVNIENITGSGADDVIFGDGNNNELRGEGGNDTLFGGDGFDQLNGGAGDDVLRGGDYYDVLVGGAGGDILDGGDDFEPVSGARVFFDVASYRDDPDAVQVNLSATAQMGIAAQSAIDGYNDVDTVINIEVINGSDFDDTLIGGNIANDEFELFRGFGGNDFIDGGSGNDRVRYREAPEAVAVNLSSTTQSVLLSGVLTNVASGTAVDGFFLNGINGAKGIDTLVSIESIQGSNFDDFLFASDSNTQFRPQGGNDMVVGGIGTDEVDYNFTGQFAPVNVNLATGIATDTFGTTDTLISIENVRGGFDADILVGSDENNRMRGSAGDDNIDGGLGVDTVDYSNDVEQAPTSGFVGTFAVTVDLGANTGTDGFGFTDTLNNIENVRGTIFDDNITGDANSNTLSGLDGDDVLSGAGGDDILEGGAGDDTADGGTGSDTLTGNAGIDTLFGGAGNDVLDGGLAGDALTGGVGADRFVLRLGDGGITLADADLITDFADGTDILELAGGLSFADLTVAQGTGANVNDTIIQHTASGEFLAVLQNVVAGNITVGDTIRAVNLSQISDGSAAGFSGFRLAGIDLQDYAGYSVSGAGDVNGDGVDDMIISAIYGDTGPATNTGEAYVIFGGQTFGSSFDLSTLDGTNGFRLEGPFEGDELGNTVSSAGDVNGDGLADIVISGIYAYGSTGPNVREDYVVFGAPTFAASIDLGALDGTDGFRLVGLEPDPDSGEYGGSAISSAGDINGDGLDDIIVGAPYGDPSGRSNAGENFVVFGSTQPFAASISLAALDGTNGGFVLAGVDATDYSGIPVASAGDINGDGIGDLVVGTPFANTTSGTYTGETYVVFGSQNFVSPFELSTVDGSNGFKLSGIDAYDAAGRSLAAGDFNGDGISDLLVGAPRGDPGGDFNAGEVYLIFGGQAFGANLDLSLLNGVNGMRFDGVDARDSAGLSLSTAGDINGDGIEDLIIGAPGDDRYSGMGYNRNDGGAYVIFGDTAFGTTFGASLDLSTLNETQGFRLDGVDPFDYAGLSVSSAGDINGDGFDDLILGAPGGDPGGVSDAGEAHVVFGGDFSGAVTQLGDEFANTLDGTGAADVLVGGQGDDFLNGNGGEDVLRGGAGNDQLSVSDVAFDKIDGGGGNDTLLVDFDLDLSGISNLVLESVEALDITGAGNNTLTLSLEDVFDISETGNIDLSALGAAIGSTNNLLVKGDTGDTVNLKEAPTGTWGLTGTEIIGTDSYDIVEFTTGAGDVLASVAIDTDVNTQIIP